MDREQMSDEQCLRCMSPIEREDTRCGGCGKPTPYMSFEELNRYEVEQYRAWLETRQATA